MLIAFIQEKCSSKRKDILESDSDDPLESNQLLITDNTKIGELKKSMIGKKY